jgi:hypothetical protein
MSAASRIARRRPTWAFFDFPDGYSCGVGKEKAPGEVFDSFAPVDCDEVKIRLGDLNDFDFPDWS